MIISCDWGTSSFRLWLVDNPSAGSAPPNIRSSLHRPTGIAATFSDWQRSGLPEMHRANFYRTILQAAIDELQQQSGYDLPGFPVILSGMATSSIGMMELPYHPLPFLVSGKDLRPAILPATPAFPHTLFLIPGVRSADDVMRGEETQLIGCPPAERLFLFPGTHSKHILVRDGSAVAFSTYMTGEFFALLSRHSILASSVADSAPSDRWRPSDLGACPISEAFLAGVDAARGSGLLHSAFGIRTNQLFGRYSKTDNYQYLSGLVIGEELKGLDRQPVTLVAVPPLREAYALALQKLGFSDVAHVDAGEALVEGHRQIYRINH